MHENSHGGEVKKIEFPCPNSKCSGLLFESKKSLRRHKLKVHEATENTYVCGFNDCARTFTNFKEYRQHRSTEHISLECNVCNKLFKTKSNLKKHMNTHSTDRTLIPCNVPGCSKVFTKNYNLKIHIQRSHNKESPFQCPKCQQKFRHKCSMQNHLKKHLNGNTKEEEKNIKKRKALQNSILGKKRPKQEHEKLDNELDTGNDTIMVEKLSI